MLITE